MRMLERVKGWAAIVQTAKQNGQTPEQIRMEMEKAIAAAWASDDPAAKALQAQLFPHGRPSPEEFVAAICKKRLLE